MKKILTLVIVGILALFEAYQEQKGGSKTERQTPSETISADNKRLSHKVKNTLQHAYKNHQSDIQIQGTGIVERVLPDDLEGSRHQKFILRVGGKTILIAHNIDLAPRIDGLRKGDSIEYYGEYEWDQRGGVVHWTHKDPRGRHESGWLKHKGKIYQ